MAKLRNTAALALAALLAAMPVQASETGEPVQAVAVYEMDALPDSWDDPQTPDQEFLRNMTTEKLYDTTADGAVVSRMAAYPVDVTAEYAGVPQYGVPADAVRGYAFRIDLDPAACWEDGTPITAEDYLYSLQVRWSEESGVLDGVALANEAGILEGRERTPETVISLEDAGFSTVAQAEEAGYNLFYLDTAHFWGLEGGWRSVTDRTRLQDYAMPAGLSEEFVSAAYLYQTYLADGCAYDYCQLEFVGVTADAGDRLTLEDLGFLQTGEYQITLILEQPTTAAALALGLNDFYLLRQDGADSYGPYRVESADGRQILLVRSSTWVGYAEDAEDYPEQILCRAKQ